MIILYLIRNKNALKYFILFSDFIDHLINELTLIQFKSFLIQKVISLNKIYHR